MPYEQHLPGLAIGDDGRIYASPEAIQALSRVPEIGASYPRPIQIQRAAAQAQWDAVVGKVEAGDLSVAKARGTLRKLQAGSWRLGTDGETIFSAQIEPNRDSIRAKQWAPKPAVSESASAYLAARFGSRGGSGGSGSGSGSKVTKTAQNPSGSRFVQAVLDGDVAAPIHSRPEHRELTKKILEERAHALDLIDPTTGAPAEESAPMKSRNPYVYSNQNSIGAAGSLKVELEPPSEVNVEDLVLQAGDSGTVIQRILLGRMPIFETGEGGVSPAALNSGEGKLSPFRGIEITNTRKLVVECTVANASGDTVTVTARGTGTPGAACR